MHVEAMNKRSSGCQEKEIVGVDWTIPHHEVHGSYPSGRLIHDKDAQWMMHRQHKGGNTVSS